MPYVIALNKSKLLELISKAAHAFSAAGCWQQKKGLTRNK
jgi:hypothetical protein